MMQNYESWTTEVDTTLTQRVQLIEKVFVDKTPIAHAWLESAFNAGANSVPSVVSNDLLMDLESKISAVIVNKKMNFEHDGTLHRVGNYIGDDVSDKIVSAVFLELRKHFNV